MTGLKFFGTLTFVSNIYSVVHYPRLTLRERPCDLTTEHKTSVVSGSRWFLFYSTDVGTGDVCTFCRLTCAFHINGLLLPYLFYQICVLDSSSVRLINHIVKNLVLLINPSC